MFWVLAVLYLSLEVEKCQLLQNIKIPAPVLDAQHFKPFYVQFVI